MRPGPRLAPSRPSVGIPNVAWSSCRAGSPVRGTDFDETLEWDGTDWTAHPGTDEGPGRRDGAGLAWDPATERMLLFSGASKR